jgi:hypothetical protein
MTPLREAVVLPLIFLTVTLLGGLEPGAIRPWVAASTFSLVLAFLLIGVLSRSGALATEQLLHGSRGTLANTNGLVVLLSLFAASAQVFHMLTPRSGVPALVVALVMFLMLLNTLVAQPDRRRVLQSLAVVLGSAFILKFVVLAALAAADGGRTRRVLVALFDLATLGTITQEPLDAAAGYLAFVVGVLYLVGIAALPVRLYAPPAGLMWPGRELIDRPSDDRQPT